MMKISKSRRNNIVFVVLIALFIIPQTRKPLQVAIHKVFAYFGPSVVSEPKREVLNLGNWKLRDLEGNQIDISSFKGKVVFLNFWATWCPPCIAEFPQIEALYKDYGDKIAFVLVSGEKPQTVEDFLSNKNYTVGSYTPLTQYPEGLNVSSIPRTFLIDQEGRIVIDKTGAANWNAARVRAAIDALLE